MSSDDPTNNLTYSSEVDKATQPTITAIFRFLHDLDKRFNGRLDKLDNRLDSLESRLARDFAGVDARFAGVDARFTEISEEMKNGFLRLSDKICDKIDRRRLHADADYEDLLRRMRKLESKAS